ncbi:MAG TPA: D-aminoacyl-tRNA deacylase [Balneolaceae bacterium]|nr:D-aminoacyl-tRNA deacylase [Balneolaceae bacterium]
MKFVIQRVHKSAVLVHGQTIGAIEKGLLVLVGIQRGDTKEDARWMSRKVLDMRIFEDADGKMNRSVRDVNGALLLVPNFTLYADASKGNRPGFSEAEKPTKARKLYRTLVQQLTERTKLTVETGEFGADMDVSLVNDGPVTIILEK